MDLDLEALFDNEHIVTCKKIVFTFEIDFNTAIETLEKFKEKHPDYLAFYKISGKNENGRQIRVVPENEKISTIESLHTIYSDEIFSLQKLYSNSTPIQLVSSNLDQTREILTKKLHPEEYLRKFNSIQINEGVTIAPMGERARLQSLVKVPSTISESNSTESAEEHMARMFSNRSNSNSKSKSLNSIGNFFSKATSSTSQISPNPPTKHDLSRSKTSVIPTPQKYFTSQSNEGKKNDLNENLLEWESNDSNTKGIEKIENIKEVICKKVEDDGEEVEWDEENVSSAIKSHPSTFLSHKWVVEDSEVEEEEEEENNEDQEEEEEEHGKEKGEENVMIEIMQQKQKATEGGEGEISQTKTKSKKKGKGKDDDDQKDDEGEGKKRRGRAKKKDKVEGEGVREGGDAEEESRDLTKKKKKKAEIKFGIMDSLLDEMKSKGEAGGFASSASSSIGPTKKKKLVEKLFQDEKGYLVTEMVMEEVDDDDPVIVSSSNSSSSTPPYSTPISSSSSNTIGKMPSTSVSKAKKTNTGGLQKGMMDFFSKKK